MKFSRVLSLSAQLLSTLSRHFLLMTATPHNGKEADFQLFMALLDGDRFEGKFRDGVHVCRYLGPDGAGLVKEQLLKFDGNATLPRAAGVHRYLPRSPLVKTLSNKQVTDYVLRGV